MFNKMVIPVNGEGGGIDPSTCQGMYLDNLSSSPYTFTDDYAFVVVFTFSSSGNKYSDKYLLNGEQSKLQYYGRFGSSGDYYSFAAFANVKKNDVLSGNVSNGRLLLYN